MALVTYRHEGQAIDYTPTVAVAAGDVIVQGDLVGVARVDIPADALGALAVAGVFDFPKAAGVGEAITVGSTVYWDAGAQQATTDSAAGANKELGKTVAAAGDNDAAVAVRLSQ